MAEVIICVSACRDESVCRVVRAGKGTVREHIAVKVIAYVVAVELSQAVVRVILEAALGSIGDITCRVVGEGFRRNDCAVA